jgi:hypothetical protein
MRRPSPLVVQVTAPLAGRTVALSTHPEDCRVILQRLAARRRREAREVLDPATAAVILTEADRFEKLIALVQEETPRSPTDAPLPRPGDRPPPPRSPR